MKIGFVIVGIISVIVMFAVYRIITVRIQSKKLNEELFARVQPLYDKLKNGQVLNLEEIFHYAQDLQTREITYQLLNNNNKTDLFPKEFFTIVKGAESNLVNWLMFPTELNACPDEIEYIKRVTIDFDGKNNFIHYEVFKYRVNEPHWAAENGWMLGVVGPYFDDSKPYDFPHSTFSRVSSTIDKVTPEEEVQWVHENISLKR